jgi:hypothetical protein
LEKKIQVPDKGEMTVNFNFSGIGLSGLVADFSGKPISGCWLTLDAQEEPGIYKAYSDMGGKYRFYSMPEGMYNLTLKAPGYAMFSDEIAISSSFPLKKDFTLRPEGILKLFAKGLEGKSSGELVSVIVDPAGYSGTVLSDAKGLFVFKNLEEGKVSVIVGGGPYSPTIVTAGIDAGETTEKNVQLMKGGFIVLEACNTGGQPLKAAKVYFEEYGLFGIAWKGFLENGFIKAEPAGFSTSDEGIFKIGPLPAGSYTIHVQHAGSSWTEPVKVLPGNITKVKAVL